MEGEGEVAYLGIGVRLHEQSLETLHDGESAAAIAQRSPR